MKTRTRRSTKRQSPSKEIHSSSRDSLLPLLLYLFMHLLPSPCSAHPRAAWVEVPIFPTPLQSSVLLHPAGSWFLSFPLFPFLLFLWWYLEGEGSRPVPTHASPTHCSVSLNSVGFVGIFSISFCLVPPQCPLCRLGLLGFSPLAFVSCLEEREEMSPALMYLISSGTVALARGDVRGKGGVCKDVGQNPSSTGVALRA